MFKFLLIATLLCFIAQAKIHNEVEYNLKVNGKSNIFVELKERLNFELLLQQKGFSSFDDMEESYRGHLIFDSLREVADKTQKNVISYLKQTGLKFEAFWIDNKIAVFDCTKEVIEALSKFEEVSEIIVVAETKLDDEQPQPVINQTKADIEIGVSHINAPKVWALGVKGKGIVVGNSDTGSIIHNDFKKTYRGNNANGSVTHDYNWFDAISTRKDPYDDHGHGTHCMGTKVGTSNNVQVGVAPEATWIVCKWLNAGGGGNAAGALKCLQFFLAPTDVNGRNPKPDKRPHITSHSYRCSCNLENAVKALVNAGVEVVVAAGNSGPRCSSVTEPAFFDSAFAVGALNRGADSIASFSSKGPHQSRVKPDISAPGVNVRSTSRSGSYTSMSGTSMACPHVAGAYALLWSGHSKLVRKIKESRDVFIKSAKKQTSNECSSRGTPNNVFGHGTIDCLKAHQMA